MLPVWGLFAEAGGVGVSASYARNHDCICILHSVCNTCRGLSPCVQAQCPLQRVTRSNPSTSSDTTPRDNAQKDLHVPWEPPPSPFRTAEPQVAVPPGAWVEHTGRWHPRVHVVVSGTYSDIVDYVESNDHGKVMILPVYMFPGPQNLEELAHTGHVLWIFEQAGRFAIIAFQHTRA